MEVEVDADMVEEKLEEEEDGGGGGGQLAEEEEEEENNSDKIHNPRLAGGKKRAFLWILLASTLDLNSVQQRSCWPRRFIGFHGMCLKPGFDPYLRPNLWPKPLKPIGLKFVLGQRPEVPKRRW